LAKGEIMAVSRSYLRHRNVFIDYDYENVMFRFDHENRRYYRKYYGKDNEVEVWFDNRLLSKAFLYGCEIDENTYNAGKTIDK
jgi:hypothetical protein